MLCPKCGQNNGDTAKFCSTCGQTLTPPTTGSFVPFPNQLPQQAPPPQQTPPPLPYGTPQAAPPPANSPYGAPSNAPGVPPLPPAYNPYGAQPQAPNPYGTAPYVQQVAPCRVCGAPLTPRDYTCPRCSAPVGTVANPHDSTAGSYLPVGGYMQMENTSGTKGAVPPEVAGMGWSWGGFGCNWIWCLCHGMVGWGLAMFLIPFVGLIGAFYMGSNGNRLAWQNRRYESIEHFKRVERIWGKWGIFFFVLGILYVVFVVFAIIGGASSSPGIPN